MKIGPYIAIIAFVVAVWPWQDKGATSSDPQTSASANQSSTKQAVSSFQVRKLKPSNFKPKKIESAKSTTKKKSKHFHVTSIFPGGAFFDTFYRSINGNVVFDHIHVFQKNNRR